jgi:hypothetical protein
LKFQRKIIKNKLHQKYLISIKLKVLEWQLLLYKDTKFDGITILTKQCCYLLSFSTGRASQWPSSKCISVITQEAYIFFRHNLTIYNSPWLSDLATRFKINSIHCKFTNRYYFDITTRCLFSPYMFCLLLSKICGSRFFWMISNASHELKLHNK